ncbi:uncharacterized protein [Triticum aestivum]|uniref:uncharacterized protein isoform X1 n=1 Tax=Triticum aestivum TaxID=4565 RepID=UPI001D013C55|nr:uncharacterized protein LOC123059281 isoform X1 [Triticum aestivum]
MAGCGGKDGLYAVLGVSSDCSDAELRSAYRKLSMKWHPDKCGSGGVEAPASCDRQMRRHTGRHPGGHEPHTPTPGRRRRRELGRSAQAVRGALPQARRSLLLLLLLLLQDKGRRQEVGSQDE